MKIGVICEGPTDFIAFEAFIGNALAKQGIHSKFVSISPDMDNTSPRGGWERVLRWLKKNPPQKRNIKFFGRGPFGPNLPSNLMDCLLIQMDADILDDSAFRNYVGQRYAQIALTDPAPSEPDARAREIEMVFVAAGWRDPCMEEKYMIRHVSLPAVETSEAWCLAACSENMEDFEHVSGQNLIDRFMSALDRSEGLMPRGSYGDIDKNLARRERFCKMHAHASQKVIDGCLQFKNAMGKLVMITPLPSNQNQ